MCILLICGCKKPYLERLMQYPFCTEMIKLLVVHNGQPHGEQFPQPIAMMKKLSKCPAAYKGRWLLAYLVLHIEFSSIRTQVFYYMVVTMARGPIKWSISMLKIIYSYNQFNTNF